MNELCGAKLALEQNTSFVMKTNVDISNAFRRDITILGQICMQDQKEKLSFVSLIRQIENGPARGYKESEIVEAVVRAISSDVQYRSYLETASPSTLLKIIKIIHFHFMEKTSTELYQELATISKGPMEDPQTFSIRCLEIRKKFCLAAKNQVPQMNTPVIWPRVYFFMHWKQV